MGPLIPNVKPQFFDSNGDPLSGGKLYVYSAGTTTEVTSYSEYTLTTANTNPIILDSRGECDLWLADGSYKFALYDSNDTLIWTEDNITIEDYTTTSTLLDKYTVDYTDIQTAATTNTATLLSLPAKTLIEFVIIKHSTAFAGGSISALTVDVGDATDADELIAAFDVVQAVAEGASQITSAPYIGAFASATNIVATFTATGDNLDQLTQGSVDIWIKKKGMN